MKTVVITAITMVAFAANSLLCRAALATEAIDPYSFTVLRIASGAAMLWVVVQLRRRGEAKRAGSWGSGLALLGYALAFSLAYVTLDAGTGALILFGGVQLTMIVGGLLQGERPPPRRWLGLALAAGGMVYLVLPGVTAPDPVGAAVMLIAGVSWGVYSLRGRGGDEPLLTTSRNFRYALPLALLAGLAGWGTYEVGPTGALLAVCSGALASGLGYALWYRALEGLTATVAAVVQLSVPVLAAAGGILLLGEQATVRLAIASVIVLGGIALAVTPSKRTGDLRG